MITGGNGQNGNGHRKDKGGHELRVVTREALFGVERARRIAKGLNEAARGTGKKPSWFQKRSWTTSNEDKDARYGRFALPGAPCWLVPVKTTWSVTASVVWGLCGVRCVDTEGSV